MPPVSIQSLLLGACLFTPIFAAIDAQLVGTWSTKSAKVMTGPVRFPLRPLDSYGRRLHYHGGL